MAYKKAPVAKPLLAEEAKALYIENKSNVHTEPAMLTNSPSYGLSAFRANIFQIADAALASGEPVPLERNGQRLWLVPERRESRIDRLPILDIIVGNPDELANLNVSEWNETRNLD
jgi:sugar/nucleoside kinase (ribokinase family)